jgi:Tfp pilus assembly protein PilF
MRRAALAAAAVTLLAGCSSSARRPALNLAPETWDRTVRELGLDPATVVCPVRATPEMQRAALQYGGSGSDMERLDRLHAALLDGRDFAFEYEKVVTFTAAEAFEAKRGNCVSFSNLLIAFARSIGIPLQAGLVLTRGDSEREGDFIVLYSHMVAVSFSGNSYSLYDFSRDRGRIDVPREMRLIDDLEIAAVALSNRGVAALREGDLAKAKDLLTKAVRLGPKLPDLHSNLGIVYWREGDVDSALATFARGLELDPHRAALLHNLAALDLQLGRVAEARAALAAASVDQASPYLLVVKGDLEYAAGDLRSALRTYKKAHSRDRSLVSPLVGIARVERSLGHPDAARKALEKARRLNPDDEQVRELLKALPLP